MTRWELIVSDEYIEANVNCIISSRKTLKNMRLELSCFFQDLRDEILQESKKGTSFSEVKNNL